MSSAATGGVLVERTAKRQQQQQQSANSRLNRLSCKPPASSTNQLSYRLHQSSSSPNLSAKLNKFNGQTNFAAKQPGYNNRAQAFLSRGAEVIIRMRGLPFSCNAQQVVDFFTSTKKESRCEILGNEDGILFVKNHDDKPTGDAFVLFASEEYAQRALQKHRQNIGARYVELFRSTISEVQQVLSISMDSAGASALNGAHNSSNSSGDHRRQYQQTQQQQQAQRQQQQPAPNVWQRKHQTGGVTYAQVATSNYATHPAKTDDKPSSLSQVDEGKQSNGVGDSQGSTGDRASSSSLSCSSEVKSQLGVAGLNRDSMNGEVAVSANCLATTSGASESSAFDNNSVNSSSETSDNQLAATETNTEQLLSASSSAQSPASTMSAGSTASSSYKSSQYSGQRHHANSHSRHHHHHSSRPHQQQGSGSQQAGVGPNNFRSNLHSQNHYHQGHQQYLYHHYPSVPAACYQQQQQQQQHYMAATGRRDQYQSAAMHLPPAVLPSYQQQHHPFGGVPHQLAGYATSSPYQQFYPHSLAAHHHHLHAAHLTAPPAAGSYEPAQQSPSGKRDCIRLRGLPFEAQVEDVLYFLGEHSKNIVYQGVHMVYSAQGQPSGEAIIQMSSCSAAQAAQECHRKVMTVGKKQRYIEVIQSSIDDTNLMLGMGILHGRPALISAPPPPAQATVTAAQQQFKLPSSYALVPQQELPASAGNAEPAYLVAQQKSSTTLAQVSQPLPPLPVSAGLAELQASPTDASNDSTKDPTPASSGDDVTGSQRPVASLAEDKQPGASKLVAIQAAANLVPTAGAYYPVLYYYPQPQMLAAPYH